MSQSVLIQPQTSPPLAHRRWRWLRVAFDPQTYRNILYLFISFPLGLVYFVVLIAGLSVGLSTVITLIGIPILLIVVLLWWGMAEFERRLTIWWLKIDIPPMYRPRPAGLTAGRWLKLHFGSSITWTSMIYLMAKFPLGLLSFVIAVLLTSLTSWLIAAPMPYLIDEVMGTQVNPIWPFWSFLLSALGFAVGLVALHVLNALAIVSGRFAHLMLGQSDLATRLTETQQVAERATARAATADQKRRELIVNVSHELRTPIASIRGHADSLLLTLDRTTTGEAAPAQPVELRNYLGIISREAEQLGLLVDELLSLARSEVGELKIDLAPVAVGEVVEEVWSSLAPLARRDRQITIVRGVAPDLPPVIADRQRLTQVLLNLVRNAITYTPAGGIISIALQQESSTQVALTVADTGIGIPEEDRDKIFERFFRTDDSRARSTGGFGLGLAIVRDFVTAMGGSVEVQSKVGEGSVFTVRLRVAPTDAGDHRNSPSAPRSVASQLPVDVQPW